MANEKPKQPAPSDDVWPKVIEEIKRPDGSVYRKTAYQDGTVREDH